ncbi:MAG: alanine racemase [Planctomycetes bacterium]|nr:alanine racemase [Planctomycetota bacterium]
MTPSGKWFPRFTSDDEGARLTAVTNRVWAEVDLERLRGNIAAIRAHVGPGTGLLAVLKANAYGHGAVAVAREVEAAGARYIGVGDLGEALELRAAGIQTPLLILGATLPAHMRPALAASVTVSIHAPAMVREMEAAAAAEGVTAPVHLKVDTGMTRLGVTVEEFPAVLRAILNSNRLRLEGVYTHLSSAPTPEDGYSDGQLARFVECLARLREVGARPPLIHCANSAGTLFHPEAHFDMVRCGIFLFGVDPTGRAGAQLRLSPVMSVRTQIIYLKGVAAGTPIGYGRTQAAPRDTVIATLPVGYNDGYRVGLSRRAEVLLRGRRAPVMGRVCMDYTMVDVGHVPGAAVGDVVTLIGRDGQEEITAAELAGILGTVPYEVFCGLGRRVARLYQHAGAGAGQARGAA